MAQKEATLLIKIKESGEKALVTIKDGLKDIAKTAAVMGAALVGAIGFSLKAFKEQEDAVYVLNQALETQGLPVEKLSKKYQDLASKLQKVSSYGDEQIMQSQAIIQGYIGQEEITEELMKATVDFAAAKRMDLAAAAELVGKSIGTETNALTRYGVALDSAGSSADKMASFINKVGTSWNDAALATTKGMGAITQAKMAFGDFLEKVGEQFAPTITAMSKAMTSFFEKLQEHPIISKIVAAVLAFGAALGLLIGAIGGTVMAVTKLISFAQALRVALAATTVTVGGLKTALRALGAATGVGLLAVAAGYLAEKFIGAKDSVDSTTKSVKELDEQIAKIKANIASMPKTITVNQRKGEGRAEVANPAYVEEQKQLADLTKAREDALAKEKEINSASLSGFKEYLTEKANIDAEMELEQDIEGKAVTDLEEMLIREQLKNDSLLAMQQQFGMDSAQIDTSRTDKIKAEIEKRKALDDSYEAKRRGISLAALQFDQFINSEKVKGTQNALNTIATLQNSNSQVLASIGKASAIASITISTARGVMEAFALGPILGPILAPIVAIAGAAQAAKVMGVQLAEGGIVKARPGGIQATIGEGGQDEAVIPLDQSGMMGGNNINITVYGGLLGDASQAHQFAVAVDEELYKLKQSGGSISI